MLQEDTALVVPREQVGHHLVGRAVEVLVPQVAPRSTAAAAAASAAEPAASAAESAAAEPAESAAALTPTAVIPADVAAIPAAIAVAAIPAAIAAAAIPAATTHCRQDQRAIPLREGRVGPQQPRNGGSHGADV